MIDRNGASGRLRFFRKWGALSDRELDEVLLILDESFPFADVVGQAETVHVHARVDSLPAYPDEALLAAGALPQNAADGYIKYAFPDGINLILSSIPVAEDDLLPSCAGKAQRPFVDHVGIDLRRETKAMKALFDSVPGRAQALKWRHVAQGAAESPVYCCHTAVGLKHWVYPESSAPCTRPLEFAYGELKIHQGKMGCDLRPIDPAHPHAALVAKGSCTAKSLER